MTRIEWADSARADFLGIVEWLQARNPDAATKVGRRILAAIERLPIHPHLGKPGRSANTRELAVTRFPYFVVYGVEPGSGTTPSPRIAILRVLHDAMMWPGDDEIAGPDQPRDLF